MSTAPWARREDVAPPMPEIVEAGKETKGVGRLGRYANLVKRSIHLKFWIASFLSSLLPDFASGIIRARIYRWAGFDIGAGAFLMGNLRLKSASPDFYNKLSIGEGATLADAITINLDGRVTIGKNVAIAPHVVIYTGSHQIGPGSKRIGAFTALPVTIEEGAWIRVGAILVPGVTVGRGSDRRGRSGRAEGRAAEHVRRGQPGAGRPPAALGLPLTAARDLVDHANVLLALTRPAQPLLRVPAISSELLAPRRIAVQPADRAGEVFGVARLVELEGVLADELGDGAQPARDHREPEDPVVDHLVRGDEVRVRRRLLGHDSDVRRVEQLPEPLVADPALEGDDVPHGHVFDLLHDGVGRLPAAEDARRAGRAARA